MKESCSSFAASAQVREYSLNVLEMCYVAASVV
jgi:hypothetical protein